jgi:hypothetical protein
MLVKHKRREVCVRRRAVDVPPRDIPIVCLFLVSAVGAVLSMRVLCRRVVQITRTLLTVWIFDAPKSP